MLATYKPIKSNLSKANSFINYIFLEVILNAKKNVEKRFELNLIKVVKYQNIVSNINHDFLLSPLQEIYKIIRKIDKKDLKVLKRALHVNNRIYELCIGCHIPVLYKDIESIDKLLAEKIKLFCNNLYEKVIYRKPFYSLYGSINEYYIHLVNDANVCKFCFMGPLLNKFHNGKRSAFDHFLPCDKFPFTSLNTKNLFPSCDVCNSKYKLAGNPLINRTNHLRRVKAIYPFAEYMDLDIDLKLTVTQLIIFPYHLKPFDFDLSINSIRYTEEAENWNDLYKIDERICAEVCSEDFKCYYEMEYAKFITHNITHQQYIDILKEEYLKRKNFIKVLISEGIYSYLNSN